MSNLSTKQFPGLDAMAEGISKFAEPGSQARPGMARNVKGRSLDFGIDAAATAKSAPYFTWDRSHLEGDKTDR